MSNELNLSDEMIFRYIDDELSTEQRTEFERRLLADQQLRDRYDRLVAIQSELCVIANDTQCAPSQDPRARRSPTMVIAASVAVVLISAAALLLSPYGGSQGSGVSSPRHQFVDGYDAQRLYNAISVNMTPQVVCDTPDKFNQYCVDSFGVAINAAFDTPATLIGWRKVRGSYDEEETEPEARILLARDPDGVPVLTFFVPDGLPTPQLEPGSELIRHESNIGGVRVFEFSPLDQPSVLGLLSAG
jgi:hypothetical protein